MFLKSLLTTCVFLTLSSWLYAQQKARFIVNEENAYNRVELKLNASSSSFNIRPGHMDKAIMVYGERTPNAPIEPIMSTELREGVLHANFEWRGMPRKAERVLASKMWGGNGSSGPNWDIYLSNTKPYDLDLKYGVGSSYLDLSGLAVERLKIYTASADVKVSYAHPRPNMVQMDSFMVKVDLGSVEIHKLNMTRAKTISADVGFGSLLLDFTEKMDSGCDIKASVGAGKLEVLMPEVDTAIRIRLHSSPLCSVTIPSDFRKIEKDLYVNEKYSENQENVLDFDLDVAMGSIVFRRK
jgi:hypothetical protein